MHNIISTSCEFCENFQNRLFAEHRRTTIFNCLKQTVNIFFFTSQLIVNYLVWYAKHIQHGATK